MLNFIGFIVSLLAPFAGPSDVPQDQPTPPTVQVQPADEPPTDEPTEEPADPTDPVVDGVDHSCDDGSCGQDSDAAKAGDAGNVSDDEMNMLLGDADEADELP